MERGSGGSVRTATMSGIARERREKIMTLVAHIVSLHTSIRRQTRLQKITRLSEDWDYEKNRALQIQSLSAPENCLVEMQELRP